MFMDVNNVSSIYVNNSKQLVTNSIDTNNYKFTRRVRPEGLGLEPQAHGRGVQRGEGGGALVVDRVARALTHYMCMYVCTYVYIYIYIYI